MSDTPRTDAEVKYWKERTSFAVCSADFARQLERELAEANKQVQLLTQGFETRQGTKLREERDHLRNENAALHAAHNAKVFELQQLRAKLNAAVEALRELNGIASKMQLALEEYGRLVANGDFYFTCKAHMASPAIRAYKSWATNQTLCEKGNDK